MEKGCPVHVEIQQTRIATGSATIHSQRVSVPLTNNVRLGLEESTGKVIHRANNIQIILGARGLDVGTTGFEPVTFDVNRTL